MSNYYIYGLFDPRYKENDDVHVKYVGQTRNFPRNRLRSHINAVKRKIRNNARLCYKEQWIKSLIQICIEPEIFIIEEIAPDDVLLNEREIYWITHYRNIGQAETNFCDGGNAMTSKHMKAIRKKIAQEKGLQTVDDKKMELFAIPSGSTRPIGYLNTALAHYCKKTDDCYDLEFDTIIRTKHPSWFPNQRVSITKDTILNMPRGSQRPDKIWTTIRNYTVKGKCFDEEFNSAIREKQPQWFINDSSKKNKEALLSMPKNLPRPNQKTELGRALVSYTSKSCVCFDETFYNEIREMHPSWFIRSHNTVENKKNLLAFMEGTQKPLYRTKLGTALVSYTTRSSSSFDESFNQIIREKQPQWFKEK